jgi:hypothetical protein
MRDDLMGNAVFRRGFQPRLAWLLAWLLALSTSMVARAQSPHLEIALEQFGSGTLQPSQLGSWRPAEALSVRVYLRHLGAVDEAASDAPITIAPVGNPWSDAVSLTVAGPDDRTVSLPWQRLGTREMSAFSLLSASERFMTFFLADSPGRVLPPGRYTFMAALEITDGPGWHGRRASEPAFLDIEEAPVPGPAIAGAIIGAEALAPGDPWVVAIDLHPLSSVADFWRTGYTLRVQDASGAELPWSFEPPALPASLPTSVDVLDAGLSPVLVELSPGFTTQVAPGTYRINLRWRSGATGPEAVSSFEVQVLPPVAAAALPGRRQAVLRQQLALATALLWRAEFSGTAQIEQLVARAAPVLIEVERKALEDFLASPTGAAAAAIAAEALFLQGDFEGALVFAQAARASWDPPEAPPELAEHLGSPIPPAELMDLLRTIEERATQGPGQVLPYLRPALVKARGWDPTDPNSPAPGEFFWATSARASSEYRASDYSAQQATGTPNVPSHTDHAKAWAPRLADAGEEWIELAYPQPVRASGIEIIQSFNPGAIVRLEVLDESGAASVVWTGPDTTSYAANQIGVLKVPFPTTAQPVVRVKVTLDTRRVAGWNEIDAIKLIPGIPALEPPALAYTREDGTGAMQFSNWPPGFILQRATRLELADWQTIAQSPPLTVQPGEAAAFFRLAGTP